MTDTYDAEKAEEALASIASTKAVHPPGLPEPLRFNPKTDVVFSYGPPLPGHANGMVIQAMDIAGQVVLQETFYSIGGGFVLTAAEQEAVASGEHVAGGIPASSYPFPFMTANQV